MRDVAVSYDHLNSGVCAVCCCFFGARESEKVETTPSNARVREWLIFENIEKPYNDVMRGFKIKIKTSDTLAHMQTRITHKHYPRHLNYL